VLGALAIEYLLKSRNYAMVNNNFMLRWEMAAPKMVVILATAEKAA
jgi:hypothetical protein